MKDINEGVIYSRRGRLIGPNKGAFPSLREVFYGLSNIPRFGGQGEEPSDWNVLKHSVCVAMIMAKVDGVGFFAGLFHDFPEMFVGDLPTPFKPPVISDFEHQCQKRLLMQLTQAWDGFDPGAHVSRDYKQADLLMLDVESRLSLRCDQEAYDTCFRCRSLASSYEKTEAETLFNRVHGVPNADLRDLVRLCVEAAMFGRGQNSDAAVKSIERLGRTIYG